MEPDRVNGCSQSGEHVLRIGDVRVAASIVSPFASLRVGVINDFAQLVARRRHIAAAERRFASLSFESSVF